MVELFRYMEEVARSSRAVSTQGGTLKIKLAIVIWGVVLLTSLVLAMLTVELMDNNSHHQQYVYILVTPTPLPKYDLFNRPCAAYCPTKYPEF